MTSQEFEKLKEWIIAIVDEKLSHDSSDGGLLESIRLSEVENEARTMFVERRGIT